MGPALIGQCRGDLALFVRQLGAVGVRVTFERGRVAVTTRPCSSHTPHPFLLRVTSRNLSRQLPRCWR